MKKHFVSFFSPGTVVSEQSDRPIASWDVAQAIRMSREIKERHGALPYGFRFYTKERGPDDLDSRVTEKSPMYYLGGRIETIADVEARNDPNERILLSNMRGNKWATVCT